MFIWSTATSMPESDLTLNSALLRQNSPHPMGRLWTWIHPAGPVHQLDHILINSKWVNSLRNCRAYNSVELDSDYRLLSILFISLRTSRGNPCKRVRLNSGKSCGTLTPECSSRPNYLIDSVDCVQPISSRCEDFETVFKEAAG